MSFHKNVQNFLKEENMDQTVLNFDQNLLKISRKKQISKLNKSLQKQPFRSVLSKRGSENMKQIYSRTPILMCDLSKVAKPLY